MVKIRLKRIGAKRKPCYRVVVIDSRKPRSGKSIEELGGYTPALPVAQQFFCNPQRIQYWLDRGAQMTPTVKKLINKYTNA